MSVKENKLSLLSIINWIAFIISVIFITLQIIPHSFSLIDKKSNNFGQRTQNKSQSDMTLSSMPDELQLFVDNIEIEAMVSHSVNGADEYYVLLSSHLKQHRMAPQNNIITYSLKNHRNTLYHCNNDKAGLGNNIYNYFACYVSLAFLSF